MTLLWISFHCDHAMMMSVLHGFCTSADRIIHELFAVWCVMQWCIWWLQVEVERTQISGNLDAPEGGFDAIMQAIACKVS